MFNDNLAYVSELRADLSSYTDRELVDEIANQSSKLTGALSELTSRHYSWVYRICLMRLGNPAYAEDVTQEVFIRLQKYAVGFEHRSTIRTWLYRVAQNQCNTFASKNCQSSFERIEDYYEVLVDSQMEHNRSNMELSDLMQHVLSKMTDKCHMIITMRFFYEMSIDEIAKTLNLGLSATKMRLYRALEQFKLIYMEEVDV